MEFITSILKSLVVLVGAMYLRTTLLFALNRIFYLVNEKAFLKRNNQSDFMACLK